MKKLLIMGGSYFIGKWTVEACKKEFETYVLNRGSKPNIDPYVHQIICDRHNVEDMKQKLHKMAFDYVIDISGVNKMQSEILMQSLDLKALKKMIYISSSAVYNIEKLHTPFKETDMLGGNSPFKDYAAHKIEAETYLKENLPKETLWIFRPPIVYGEDNYILRERLIFKWIESETNIYVPKSNHRIQFVYVKDLAEQIKDALLDNIPSGIYNVGYTQAPTFTTWIKMCEAVVGIKAHYQMIDHHKLGLDIRTFFPFFDYDNILDVSKLKTYSTIETPMSIGLSRAYEDYIEHRTHIEVPDVIRQTYAKLKKMVK